MADNGQRLGPGHPELLDRGRERPGRVLQATLPGTYDATFRASFPADWLGPDTGALLVTFVWDDMPDRPIILCSTNHQALAGQTLTARCPTTLGRQQGVTITLIVNTPNWGEDAGRHTYRHRVGPPA